MFSWEYCEIFKNTYCEKHLRTTAFEISWKCFLIREIGIIIMNFYENRISCGFYCTYTVVIRLTNKRAQLASFTTNLVWHFKKMTASVREKKTSSRSWLCELDEGHSLWEINLSEIQGTFKNFQWQSPFQMV